MGTGQDFERALVKAFNEFFELSGTRAIAYRRPQTRYQPQLFDIFVDSRGSELYLAIECKQVDNDAYETIYFSSHFGKTKGVSQVKRESDLLVLSLGVRRVGNVGRFLFLGSMFGITSSAEIRIFLNR